MLFNKKIVYLDKINVNMKNMNEQPDLFYDIDIDAFHKVAESIQDVLIEKNKRYGNSALEPLNVFYKGSATDSICIRLDDKLSRIKNSTILRKNDLYDLLGYCLLYMVKCDVGSAPFEAKLRSIINSAETSYINGLIRVNKYIGEEPYPRTGYLYDGFSKENYIDNPLIKSLNGVCSEIKANNMMVQQRLVQQLINFLIVYFIQNGITDFSDLID